MKNFYPDGDFSVDAVTGTAMLIDVDKIKEINGWDKNIFNYYEDMDLCIRLRQKGYEIVKIFNSTVDHFPFSSHEESINKEMDYSRVWHHSWSFIYFFRKHDKFFFTIYYSIKVLFLSSLKILIYAIFKPKSFRHHKAKFLGTFCSLLFIKSFYRPKISK